MQLPFFYIPIYDASQNTVLLNEETSRHVVQVLRMKTGEQLQLTDGKGALLKAVITADDKKRCTVAIQSKTTVEKQAKRVCIAISILKNSNRFEWFLEKATEIGVTDIIPLLCARTEKEKFRYDRMQGICISAMLQSQQCWLPLLHEPVSFANLPVWKIANGSNFIAHCMEANSKKSFQEQIRRYSDQLIAIGPEGDFTTNEIELALANEFVPVSLGETRLRTETAGVVAATLLCHI